MEGVKEFIATISGSGYGSGSGSGSGSGYGSGYGYGDGYGSGSGDGWGSGWGSGYGWGSGWGSGYGDGSGSGYGSGSGSGYGSGSGSGYGSGYGYGYGDGYGSGSGDGYGIKSFNGDDVHQIDDTPTIITVLRGNVAKGYILGDDLHLTPCYIVKSGNTFAHGKSLRNAQNALAEKLFDDMPIDERIDAFIEAHREDKPYSCFDLYDWHHKLTGSCEMGRKQFAKDNGIDIEDGSMTVSEFIELTKNAYGGEVIKALEKAIKERK